MPRKHQITNGPSFRYFMFMSTAVSGSGNVSSFTLTDREFGDDRDGFYILAIGKSTLMEDDDQYVFIARSHAASQKLGTGPYWIVGTYNTRTRQGECVGYEAQEFIQAPIAQVLFRTDFGPRQRS